MAQPLHKLGAVAVATGVSGPVLSRWLDRGVIKTSRRDAPSSGSGSHRGFCRTSVIQIAIAKALVDLGIAPGRANQAATVFTDYGQPGRPPGELHPFGTTLLLVSSDSSRVVNGQFSDTLTDITGRPLIPSIIIDLSPIVQRVELALKDSKT